MTKFLSSRSGRFVPVLRGCDENQSAQYYVHTAEDGATVRVESPEKDNPTWMLRSSTGVLLGQGKILSTMLNRNGYTKLLPLKEYLNVSMGIKE